MNHRSIDELERDLRSPGEDVPAGPDLATIHRLGDRRRRVRAVLAGGTAALVLVGGGAVLGTVLGDDGAGGVPTVAKEPAPPKRLSPLAERVLDEVPGAVQVSRWQVVVPAPGEPAEMWSQPVPDDVIDAGPVDIGARRYLGVTSYGRDQFPAWLHDGVKDIEENELGDESGHPVGSTEMGILVDAGPLELACTRPLPEWGGDPQDGCSPAMLGEHGGELTYEWGLGTDDFLRDGADLELFSSDDYATGSPRTVWVGGTDGTDVASVELVATDGTRVDAIVAAGTLVPGETMFWGTVDGELAEAVTRDAAGAVLEQHPVRPCDDPVECEVR